MIGVKYEFEEVEETPENLNPNTVYVCDSWKQIGFLCPCGCGDKIVIAMRQNPEEHPSWTVNVQAKSVSPSINKQYGCRSHFTITNGITH